MSISHSTGSPTSMVFIDGTAEVNEQLSTLMEDYVRAIQLQNSLKKRMELLMKARKEAAEAKAEQARLQWVEAEADCQKMIQVNALFLNKMEETEKSMAKMSLYGLEDSAPTHGDALGSTLHSPASPDEFTPAREDPEEGGGTAAAAKKKKKKGKGKGVGASEAEAKKAEEAAEAARLKAEAELLEIIGEKPGGGGKKGKAGKKKGATKAAETPKGVDSTPMSPTQEEGPKDDEEEEEGAAETMDFSNFINAKKGINLRAAAPAAGKGKKGRKPVAVDSFDEPTPNAEDPTANEESPFVTIPNAHGEAPGSRSHSPAPPRSPARSPLRSPARLAVDLHEPLRTPARSPMRSPARLPVDLHEPPRSPTRSPFKSPARLPETLESEHVEHQPPRTSARSLYNLPATLGAGEYEDAPPRSPYKSPARFPTALDGGGYEDAPPKSPYKSPAMFHSALDGDDGVYVSAPPPKSAASQAQSTPAKPTTSGFGGWGSMFKAAASAVQNVTKELDAELNDDVAPPLPKPSSQSPWNNRYGDPARPTLVSRQNTRNFAAHQREQPNYHDPYASPAHSPTQDRGRGSTQKFPNQDWFTSPTEDKTKGSIAKSPAQDWFASPTEDKRKGATETMDKFWGFEPPPEEEEVKERNEPFADAWGFEAPPEDDEEVATLRVPN